MRKFLVIFFILFPIVCFSHDLNRPKIGLVLSGGGAKGGAHIGVIQALEELNIPIDYVVGTSMGAVVGGLYAAGYNGKQIENILTNVDWNKTLLNKIERDNLYYRRKRDDNLFLIREVIGIDENGLKFPRGVIQGHKLYQTYKKHTLGLEPIGSFDNLKTPYRAVATNLVDGKKIVLHSGDLAKAMYASMAVPGLFPPVEVGDKLLVDGGVVANIPVQTAKNMGADIVIVVDVGAKLFKKNEIISLDSVLDQLSTIQVRDNAEKVIRNLSSRDILITPVLEGIGTADYEKISEAILPGKKSLYSDKHLLEKYLSAKEIQYSKTPSSNLNFQNVLVHNNTVLDDKVFTKYPPLPPRDGSIESVDDYISKIYGLEMFEKIDYEIIDNQLSVTPFERSWGPNYLQGTLFLQSDFEGNNIFFLGLGLTKTMLNSLAGELRIFGTMGEKTGIFAEWYQPVTTSLDWFVNPLIKYTRSPVRVYSNDEELARYLSTESIFSFRVGKNFNQWGRVEIGYSFIDGSYRLITGNPVIPESNFDEGIAYGRFEWDTFDDSFFPHNGTTGNIEYDMHRKGLGGDSNFDQLSVSVGIANSLGKHTGLIGARYESTTSGYSSLNSSFNLGGLFSLSGLAQDQLSGQQAALVSAIYYYRLADLNVLPNYPFPLYLGTSLEVGNAWNTDTSLFKHSFRAGGSIFLGIESIIGPFYLGYGFTENGKRAVHLFMGRPIQ
jgi:NTE family protein